MSAVLSPCGTWRYWLEREIEVRPGGIIVALCGVNPSTADATVNDQTIRKDIGFAKVHGWRRIIKVNPFAFRATDVRELAGAVDPVGPENHRYLARAIAEADALVPCWGDAGKVPRGLRPTFAALLARMLDSGKPVLSFGLTAGGDPKHPLMLPYKTPLIRLDANDLV